VGQGSQRAPLKSLPKAGKKSKRTASRCTHCRAVKQKHFRELAGRPGHPRQTKQLQDFERRYLIPSAGKTIDLYAWVAGVWDLIAANTRRIVVTGTTEQADSLEYWRKEHERTKTERGRLSLERDQGRLIGRPEHDRELDRLCVAFSAILARLPQEVGMRVVGKPLAEVRAELTRWANEVADQCFGPPEGSEK